MKSFLLKAAQFCVYQERTQQEVRDKLYSWGATTDEVEEVIAYLISENYLNESRFARQFAGGKFRVKKWGRRKIRYELKGRGLSERCIEEGMAEIPDDDYRDVILELLEKQREKLKSETNPLVRQKKMVGHLVNKGFEPDIVLDLIKKGRP
jgi:regulatory protein